MAYGSALGCHRVDVLTGTYGGWGEKNKECTIQDRLGLTGGDQISPTCASVPGVATMLWSHSRGRGQP